MGERRRPALTWVITLSQGWSSVGSEGLVAVSEGRSLLQTCNTPTGSRRRLRCVFLIPTAMFRVCANSFRVQRRAVGEAVNAYLTVAHAAGRRVSE
ncbi:hypothetical protein M8818_006324 [Zalaria obscura]|uniref:Uncharacterized protein n=1 Tax=Zalaria obscura TaxID=2024903 RepID=A0ACC3S6D1_9PEZI